MSKELIEVKKYEKQILLVQEKANELVIKTEEDMEVGSDLLDQIKLV